MRTAVMGAGSIGMFLGAMITKNGGQIDLIDTFQANVDALKANGARITGKADFTVPVSALTPDEMEGAYDLIILCTKQVVNEEVIGYALPHLAPDGCVLTLQNGIPEPSIEALVGKGRVVGGTVGFGATWLEPGVDMLTSPLSPAIEKFAFDIGEMDGQDTPRIQAIQRLLSLCGGTTVLPNLMNVRWTKLLINATLSGMSAALGCTFGDVLDGPESLDCAVHLADEALRVAKAEGYRLTHMLGADFNLLELKDEDDVPNKYEFFQTVWGPHRALKASMLQDLEKKRKTEIGYINGVVSTCGKAHGIPTPFNDMVCQLVAEAESKGAVNQYAEAIQAFLPILKERKG